MNRAGPPERVDAKARFGKPGDRLGRIGGAEGDHERVGRNFLSVDLGGTCPRIDARHLAPAEFDPARGEPRERPREVLGPAGADHEPEERRRKEMAFLAIDHGHAVLRGQELAQRLGDNHAAEPRTENQDAPAHGCAALRRR